MKKITGFILLFCLIIISVTSCKKNNAIDGGVHNAKVNMSTYDYLKSKGALFDTLVLLIDRTGLKEQINSSITFFAPTDYCIQDYIRIHQQEIRDQTFDENYIFNFDSLDLNKVRDTLKMYMIDKLINRSDLEAKGNQLVKSLSGDTMYISLRETQLYTEYTPGFKPKILYYRKVVKGLDPIVGGAIIPETERDLENRCQTSGIITTTGVLHVMDDLHTFSFR